ncbi:hypothetical protein QR680_003016 [Steinernema hermaphroditum]|uniref:Exocyst complex component 5 n=1 Tax=Steinernema hermaphroditum TaxID=289476 RepID=A0AA39LJG6_9BILA|nr:hypothetical protein QR680_003016 [Steinernema hermaphroditum]
MGDRYFATYVQDLEQDPFDAIDFVERLAWRITGTTENINATILKSKFEDEIASLQMLSEQFQSKINTVEAQVSREKQEYLSVLQSQQDRNATVLEKLKQLDGTMQVVSTKVVHLGDQLEGVHAPRARAYETLQLMKHFDEFLADQPLSSAIFTDPDQLLESAEMIQKLYSVSQELAKDKFLNVQLRIAHKYEEIEGLMIEEFVKAHQNGDRRKMKDVAVILSEFKRYSACLDAFVEHMQYGAFRSTDVFCDVLALCEKTYPMLEEIFPNPQQVMAKLILNLFQGKLKDAVHMKLEDVNGDSEVYLTSLYELYMKTQKLVGSLRKFTSDSEFLPILSRSVFGSYLNTYVVNERAHITEQCSSILQRFYESKGHQKKQFTGLQELKRGIQARLLTVENYGGETFLSEEVAINILQEFKNAFMRCNAMAEKKDSPKFTEQLFDLMLKYLYKDHVEYAIELALSCIQLSESKTEAPGYFFPVVQQTAAITHLFVKQFDDSIMPLVEGTIVENSCVSKRDSTLQQVEGLIDAGIERQLNSLVSYVRYVLQNEQKRADFKPEIPTSHISCTTACSTVVRFVARQVDLIRDSVDGENLDCILSDFGDRLYNVILVQIRSFTYNTTGALLLMYDINEYRKCVEKWGMKSAIKKFDTLKSLTNLLIVEPNNLAEASSSLGDIDRSMINSFIQLRGDCKSVRAYMPFL